MEIQKSQNHRDSFMVIFNNEFFIISSLHFLLFIISSASRVSDAETLLMKEFVTNSNSLRFETTMSTNPQSIVNMYD